MSLLRKTTKIEKFKKLATPHKATPSKNSPVVDDPALAAKMFGGSRFDMIVAAAARARQLRTEHCSGPTLPKHQPTVMALFEIQEGKLSLADILSATNEEK